MFERKGLVREGFGAVDAGAAGAVAVEEVAALDHEVFDLRVARCSASVCMLGGFDTHHSVELAAFVALRSALRVLGLTRAVLAEVLGRFGGRVGEELHFDAAERFSWGWWLGVG